MQHMHSHLLCFQAAGTPPLSTYYLPTCLLAYLPTCLLVYLFTCLPVYS